MKIKSLSLHGFKSFADRTEVDFHEGMTAIVGPNGCGKSNISDAIRWVLGEQAPSAIRGSRMEEAIFGGTEERRPISRAEVSLTLSNADGTLPVPHSEVVIGRTVYRGGESEYRLNGEVCRLRDIQDLCRDTGLGATEYSIIEGRMIDAILSDRAEERRALFEEAAEIGRYKDRRKTALRRLDQAEADLERLEDVMGEVRTKVRSLAQQRGRAERYQEHRERRLRLEVGVAGARLRDLERREERAEGELERLRDEQPAEEGQLQTRETRAEKLRVEIAERERRRSRKAQELADVRDRLEQRERRRMLASERRATAERRLETLGAEMSSLDERVRELEERAERHEAGVREERSAVDELAEREEALKEEAVSLRAERDRRREEKAAAEDRLADLEREVRLLEADRDAAASQIEERRDELGRRRDELENARSTAGEAGRAADEARGLAAENRKRVAELEEELGEAEGLQDRRRRAVRELRDEIGEVEGALSGRRARVRSLSGLLESGDDLPPVVGRLLEADVDGVLGVLADAV
ncbi:MAG: AAA family ATPase, partial [Gemmatimonadota bacterium]